MRKRMKIGPRVAIITSAMILAGSMAACGNTKDTDNKITTATVTDASVMDESDDVADKKGDASTEDKTISEKATTEKKMLRKPLSRKLPVRLIPRRNQVTASHLPQNQSLLLHRLQAAISHPLLNQNQTPQNQSLQLRRHQAQHRHRVTISHLPHRPLPRQLRTTVGFIAGRNGLRR